MFRFLVAAGLMALTAMGPLSARASGIEALISFHGADDLSWERRAAVQDLLRRDYGFDRLRVLVDATAEEIPVKVRQFLEKPAGPGDRRLVWVSGLIGGTGKTICPAPDAAPVRPAAPSLILAPDCYASLIRFPQGARHYGMTAPSYSARTARLGRTDAADPAFIGFLNLPQGEARFITGADALIFDVLKTNGKAGLIDPGRLLARLRAGFRLSGTAYTPSLDMFFQASETHVPHPFGFARGAPTETGLRRLSRVDHRAAALRVHDRPNGNAPALVIRKPGPIRVLRSDRSGAMRYVAIGKDLYGWVRRHDLAL